MGTYKDDWEEMMYKLEEQNMVMAETNEEFIFYSLLPYSENVLKIELDKEKLKMILRLGHGEAIKRGLLDGSK